MPRVPGDPSLGTRLSDYLVAVQSALYNDTPMRPEIVSSASASPRLRRTFSNAGSMDSSVSAQSSQSWKSHMSLDSRGPRQGRRRLKRTDDTNNINNHNNPNSKKDSKFYCTSPSCDATFLYRSDWVRHEEALHYCPYNWVCCAESADRNTMFQVCFVCGQSNVSLSHFEIEHFAKCATSDQPPRKFLREDQLHQHIKRIHKVSWPIRKTRLNLWKTTDPAMLPTSLCCGFCGVVCDDWEQRQDHVFEHFQSGAWKSACWTGRLPNVQTQTHA
jgi:hypothetical protein